MPEFPKLRRIGLEFEKLLRDREDVLWLLEHAGDFKPGKLLQISHPSKVEPTAEEERDFPESALHGNAGIHGYSAPGASHDLLRGTAIDDLYHSLNVSRQNRVHQCLTSTPAFEGMQLHYNLSPIAACNGTQAG